MTWNEFPEPIQSRHWWTYQGDGLFITVSDFFENEWRWIAYTSASKNQAIVSPRYYATAKKARKAANKWRKMMEAEDV